MTRVPNDKAGFTLVELLVTAVVFGIVLTLVVAIFTSQSRLNSLLRSQSEVRDQVNLTMQLLGSELSLAGQTAVFTEGSSVDISFEVCPPVKLETGDKVQSCLELTNDPDDPDNPDGTGPILRLAYADSITYTNPEFATGDGTALEQACRIASYRITADGELQRANKQCPKEDGDIVFNFTEGDYETIVEDVRGFDINLVCSDNGDPLTTYPVGTTTICNPNEATTGGVVRAYPRAVRFAIVARQGTSYRGRPAFSFKPPWSSTTLVTCGEGEVCFGLAQEFAMPNMSKER